MSKISQYTRALKAKLSDLFVVASSDNGSLSTKAVTTEQVGDAIITEQTFSGLDGKTPKEAISDNTTAIGSLSSLTTTDKSSLVGAVNEVNSVETKTLVTNATYYKTSKVVQVSLVGYSVPANTGGYSSRHIIGYLPVGYRPIVNAYAPYISDNIKTLMIGASNGEVSIRNSSGSTEYAYISITFLTN